VTVPVDRIPIPIPNGVLPANARRVLWAALSLNVMAAAWMLSAGDWLDAFSRVTSVATLGGHHVLVLWLAVVGFVMLTVLAVLTRGFAAASRVQAPFLVLAGVVSIVATSGILSVAALVVLVAVIGRVLFGRGLRR
jgi:hypothetical protein